MKKTMWAMSLMAMGLMTSIPVTAETPNPLAQPAANPLAQSAQAGTASNAPNPPGAPAAATMPVETFGDFSVLGAGDSGRTLFLNLKDCDSLQSAITQTADALAKAIGNAPALQGAFADSKFPNRGGANFTCKWNGKDARGMILCQAGSQGPASPLTAGTPKSGSAIVLLLPADAPKEEVERLMNFIPQPIKLTRHEFPDGSGSIDLPEGWTTPDETASFGIGVKGPQGQGVVFNACTVIYEPNSSIVRTQHQTYQTQVTIYQTQIQQYQQLQQWHRQNPNSPLPPEPQPPKKPSDDPNMDFPGMVFCRPCSGAAETLKFLFPVYEAKGKAAGQAYTSLDQVISVAEGAPNPYIAASASGAAYFVVTDHYGDKAEKFRVVRQFATCPVMQGECWQLNTTLLRAPDATFERDLPIMNAIIASVHLNMDVVNGKIKSQGEAMRKLIADNTKAMLERGRMFQQLQDDRFCRIEAGIHAQEKAMHDSASDFIEYIGGMRTVVDQKTGETKQVDLSNVNTIVDDMNQGANDPNRFKQVPLREQR